MQARLGYFGETAVRCGIAPPSGFDAIPSSAAGRSYERALRAAAAPQISAQCSEAVLDTLSRQDDDAVTPEFWVAVMNIVVWLRSLGLGRYEAAFRDNEIDETVLPSLTHENLKELGVTALGHRLKLLDAIAALRADTSAKAACVDATIAPSAQRVAREDRAERRQGRRLLVR